MDPSPANENRMSVKILLNTIMFLAFILFISEWYYAVKSPPENLPYLRVVPLMCLLIYGMFKSFLILDDARDSAKNYRSRDPIAGIFFLMAALLLIIPVYVPFIRTLFGWGIAEQWLISAAHTVGMAGLIVSYIFLIPRRINKKPH